MRFLVDVQLPPALARWIASKGHEAEHVRDRLGADRSDVFLAGASIAAGSVVISKDSDFLRLQADGKPPVIWVRLGNSTNVALLALFELEWQRILDSLSRGEPVVEVG